MFMKDIIPVRPKTCKHCGRQLKANIIKVKVPYFASASAFKLRTFNYFDPEHWYSYYSKARFTVVSSKLNFIVSRPMLSKCVGLFINSFPRLYEKFISQILPAEELETHLVVKKSF
jgi:hypothetical protein